MTRNDKNKLLAETFDSKKLFQTQIDSEMKKIQNRTVSFRIKKNEQEPLVFSHELYNIRWLANQEDYQSDKKGIKLTQDINDRII